MGEEQHAVADLRDLVHVVGGPQHRRAGGAKPRITARMSRAMAGSSEAVGSSSSRRCGRFSIAFARPTRVCSPDESTPHFVWRKRSSVELREQLFDPLRHRSTR